MRTAHRVYLAADSRCTNPQSDTAHKLFRFGDRGFVGLVGTLVARAAPPGKTVEVLDLMDTLAQISGEDVGEEEDPLRYAALQIYAKLKPYWMRNVESGPAAFLNSGTVTGAIFTVPGVRRFAHDIRVAELHFPFSASSGEMLAPQIRERSERIIGWGQLPNNAGDIPQPSDSERSVLTYIDAMYQSAALAYPDSVGGQTDIGFVDRNGTILLSKPVTSL